MHGLDVNLLLGLLHDLGDRTGSLRMLKINLLML
jgi:hypothetical protein